MNQPPDEFAATDRTLVRRFQSGQNAAATELYVRYADRLAKLARLEMSPRLNSQFDPEDVVQSVFRTFFRRANEPYFQVPSGDQIWQLLLVIATNKVRKLGRYARQQKRDVGRTVAIDEASSAASDDHASLAILEMVVRDSLEGLPEYQRTMIELRIQGYTTEEIAARTQRCTRTVERIVQRFRDQMNRIVEASDVEPD
jgi:RNA polymerase sigma-70 factor (ECF subfamily)